MALKDLLQFQFQKAVAAIYFLSSFIFMEMVARETQNRSKDGLERIASLWLPMDMRTVGIFMVRIAKLMMCSLCWM